MASFATIYNLSFSLEYFGWDYRRFRNKIGIMINQLVLDETII